MSEGFVWGINYPAEWGLNLSQGNVQEECLGGLSGVIVLIPLQDYRPLCVAVVMWATKVNKDTQRDRHRQLLTGCRPTSP